MSIFRLKKEGQKKQQAVRSTILRKLKTHEYKLKKTNCLCGNSRVKKLSCFDKHYLPFPLVICDHCGIVRLGKRLDQKSLQMFYDNEYRPLYNPGLREDVSFYREHIHKSSEEIKNIVSILPRERIKKTLDVGCHFGNLVYQFEQMGYESYGIDYDSHSTKFARKELGLRCFTGGIDRFHDSEDQFDLITYIHVFEHVNSLDSELQKLRRIIRDGGYLYLSVPGLFHWIEKKNGNILNTIQCAHSWYFTLSSLRYVVERNGFEFINGNEKVQAFFKKLSEKKLAKKHPDDFLSNKRMLCEIEKKYIEKRANSMMPSWFVKLSMFPNFD